MSQKNAFKLTRKVVTNTLNLNFDIAMMKNRLTPKYLKEQYKPGMESLNLNGNIYKIDYWCQFQGFLLSEIDNILKGGDFKTKYSTRVQEDTKKFYKLL